MLEVESCLLMRPLEFPASSGCSSDLWTRINGGEVRCKVLRAEKRSETRASLSYCIRHCQGISKKILNNLT